MSIIPTSGLEQYITELAQEHGIHYVRTPNDALADVVTRMSDDEVIPDAIEDLIVALKRAEIIDAPTMVSLLGNYLDEKRQQSIPNMGT